LKLTPLGEEKTLKNGEEFLGKSGNNYLLVAPSLDSVLNFKVVLSTCNLFVTKLCLEGAVPQHQNVFNRRHTVKLNIHGG